ncbi:unnamed protein product [Lymnaea stagnalis]|uniref:APOBEC-like N-terminal domain-containing protein n=1 Tax=Lymnaea stagnalis TaxID=6523 RepID=A0AAV2I9K2_LYMST
MAKDDFDIFWRSHLMTPTQGYQIPEPTILYWNSTKDELSNFPWTRREGTPRSHATAAVARDLMTQVRVANKRALISVTIVQNYSPCFDCAEELLKTISLAGEKQIKLDISLAFVALHRIRRQSWVWRGLREAHSDVTINESNDNSLALRNLKNAGVRMSTFTPDTWTFLFTFLGNGLTSCTPGKFLGGKYGNCDSRLEEDRLMQQELVQILKGLHILSESVSPENTSLVIEWNHPPLLLERVQEYKICCKKVTAKNKDGDDTLWKMSQALDKVGIRATVAGEMTWCKVTGLDTDAFYDVTVEATISGMVVCQGRKLLKTANKVIIPALQTPTLQRKSSTTSARPRTSTTTSTSPHGGAVSPQTTSVRRSNSTRESGTSAGARITSGVSEGPASPRCGTVINAEGSGRSAGVGTANSGLSRSNSLRLTSSRPTTPTASVSERGVGGGARVNEKYGTRNGDSLQRKVSTSSLCSVGSAKSDR